MDDTEGLDLYFDVNMNTAAPDATAVLAADVFNVVYGLKRKSSATCS